MTNQWISVKDRLPEKQTAVLVVLAGGSIAVHWLYGSSHLNDDVTYWMQLPEPPPPPDPFEVWAKAHEWPPYPSHIAITNDENESVSTISKHCARKIWNAALASTKKP